MTLSNWRLIAGSTTFGLLTLVGFLALWKRMRQSTPPKKWKKVGTVRSLYMYPIKSGRWVAMNTGMATSLGFKEILENDDKSVPFRDRFLMIYYEGGMHISSAKYNYMVKLSVAKDGENSVKLLYPEREEFVLNLPKAMEDKSNLASIEMYDKEKIPCIDCGNEAAVWVSKAILGMESGLRLGYWSEAMNTRRDFSKTKFSVYKKFRSEDTGAFSDMSSFMLLNNSSLEDMQSRIGKNDIGELNFRPNIVVDGPEPYAEDSWDWLKIGEMTVFRNFKPCTRCARTTLDPETGNRHPELEPLKTLRKYRQLTDPKLRNVEGTSPAMGIYIGLYQEGLIKLGDPVYIG